MATLFLCTANSCRSQMAEGLFRHLAPRESVHSAGTDPGSVHPLAIRCLRERGIDISDQRSKSIEEIPLDEVDRVITLCDEAALCPSPPVRGEKLHWSIPDPAAATTESAPAAEAAPSAQAEPAQAIPDHISPPDLIEITDDMAADEVRKARISNAKAMSAYKKALKEAGIDPAMATAEPPPAAEAPPAAQAEPAKTAASADIPPPDLTEITDDMSPDEIRQARINNARAKSAYKKALKEAGIDPSTVDI